MTDEEVKTIPQDVKLASLIERAVTTTNSAVVLLVETEQPYSDETAAALEDAGYRVIACGTAMDALEILDGPEKIDFLVTRVLMSPGQMHGIALARMCRCHSRDDRRQIRILIHAQRYHELPREVLESALGTIYHRPSSGVELYRLFQREFGFLSDSSNPLDGAKIAHAKAPAHESRARSGQI